MTPDQLADRLETAARRIRPAVRDSVEHAAELGRAQIKGHASGRPGPNVITGQYRNSWQIERRHLPYGAQCTIGTMEPYGRRLEFGFVGADSLGRVYNQPPFPHVQPALPAMTAALRFGMISAVAEALR
ncbi:HK97 gp10 family phage protein [Streptomyces sp. NPDC048611]|uniref:HK97 gp10 family phage protein n=1 Tax=Streptomyces sp. NPDC048611 TaxID=3155635 RepID=UPI00342D84C0